MIYNNKFKAWFISQKLVKPTYKEGRRSWSMKKKVKDKVSSIQVCKLINTSMFDVVKMEYKGKKKDWNFEYLTALCYLVHGESYRTHYILNEPK